jgi:predicted ATPase/DNA-binding SARP family transcriptional activator
MPKLSLHLLGAPRIILGNQAVDLDTRKAVALLAYLAVTGQRHTRDSLVAFLWPEYDQRRGRAALRRTLSTLKSAVGGYGLAIERESLGLDWSADIWVDVLRFKDLLGQTRNHGHSFDESCPACLAPLSEAVDLYPGDFMSGFSLRDSPPFDDWSYLQGESLRRELSSALQGVMRCLQMERRYREAINYGSRLLDLDPLHEPAHRQLMALLALDGQRTAALQHYRDCVRILETELGVPPLAETTAIYEDILSGQFPEQDRSGSLTGIDMVRVMGQQGEFNVSQEAAFLEDHAQLPRLPLVGRSQEMRTILEWYKAAGPAGRLLLLEGEAGIGKTRLAGAFLEFVRTGGGLIVAAQCYEGEAGLAYAPIVEAFSTAIRSSKREWPEQLPDRILAEGARLFPDLLPHSPLSRQLPPLESTGAQHRFFDAMVQLLMVICGPAQTGVLFLDDIQWADDASIDLLNYLVRRLRNWPLFILLSWRDEDLPAGHLLRNMLAYAQREGFGKRVPLTRLDAAAVNQLVGATTVPEEMAERLLDETEGLPYFLVEYLSLISQQENGLGGLKAVPAGQETASVATLPMPEGVRELLRSRLRSVGEIAQQMLQTAAVIGRSFGVDLLLEVSGRNEEEIVSALDSLLAQGLLIERPAPDERPQAVGALGSASPVLLLTEPAFDFNHEKLRTYVYEEMSLARRRLLHKRVAFSLADARNRKGSDGLFSAAQAAYHFQLAGMEGEAAEYFKQAGDNARALYANTEALTHYKSALALGYEQPAVLHEAIGDLLTLRGSYNQALSNYEGAAALIDPIEDAQVMSRLEMKLGEVYHRRGEWILAASHYEQAFNRMADGGQKARLLTDWSLTTHHSGDSRQALDLARQALDLADPIDDQIAMAQAYNVLGILANSRGDWQLANQHLEQSLSLAQIVDEPGMIIAALNNLSIARRFAGEPEQAIEYVGCALSLCLEVGDRHREAALHNNLADLYHLSGAPEDSMVHLKQAVAIYAEIGGEPGKWQPEIWKLTEW